MIRMPAAAVLAIALTCACSTDGGRTAEAPPEVIELALAFPDKTPLTPPPADACNAAVEELHQGSTHEIAFDPQGGPGAPVWVSGQNYDTLARVPGTGGRPADFLAMPEGSGPHGLAFDGLGRLWVTLEFAGRIRALAPDGRVLADVDVGMPCAAIPGGRTNPRPHGLAVAADGRTLWFTGKATGTLGRIDPDGKVTHFPLTGEPRHPQKSKPIYVHAGPDGAMWATELEGNRIARVSAEGQVSEFPIPTQSSRPIAIVPGRDGAMWFSEEAGSKIGRIDKQGRIREFAVPRGTTNLLLAGLGFDRDGNLWTQQYVDHANPAPAGADSLVRIGREGLEAWTRSGGTAPAMTFHAVPTRDTVMHRIAPGPDGAMLFTEMHADKLGRVAARRGR